MKAKKSGRLLSAEPIQIFWHAERQQTRRSEPHDPRLSTSSMEQRHMLPPPPPPYIPQPPPSFEFPPGQTRFETGLADHQLGLQQHQVEMIKPGEEQVREGRLVGFTKPDNQASDEEIMSRKILQTKRKRQTGFPQRPAAIGVKRQRASDGGELTTGTEEVVGGTSAIPVLSGGGGKMSVWERLGGRAGEREEERGRAEVTKVALTCVCFMIVYV